MKMTAKSELAEGVGVGVGEVTEEVQHQSRLEGIVLNIRVVKLRKLIVLL